MLTDPLPVSWRSGSAILIPSHEQPAESGPGGRRKEACGVLAQAGFSYLKRAREQRLTRVSTLDPGSGLNIPVGRLSISRLGCAESFVAIKVILQQTGTLNSDHQFLAEQSNPWDCEG